MKIEFAPPGTDPTNMKSDIVTRGGGNLSGFVQSNGLLLAGIFGFVLLGAVRFGWFESNEPTEPQRGPVEATPTPAVIREDCLYLDSILIPDGQTVMVGGDRWVNCLAGEIFVMASEGRKP
jgi:hypothetical protein